MSAIGARCSPFLCTGSVHNSGYDATESDACEDGGSDAVRTGQRHWEHTHIVNVRRVQQLVVLPGEGTWVKSSQCCSRLRRHTLTPTRLHCSQQRVTGNTVFVQEGGQEAQRSHTLPCTNTVRQHTE